MAAIDVMNNLRGLFDDAPELYLVKGGKWNEASTFINLFLTLISSTLMIVQESQSIIVCISRSKNNKTVNVGSNYAYIEEECEDQILDQFPLNLFHKYIGWVFTCQVIVLVIWSRIWIGGNRVLIERCSSFGLLKDSFSNVTGHMTDEERKDLWINQDYLQRSNKMFLAELRTNTEIRKSKLAQLSGNIILSSLFSIFNICILHFTNSNHISLAVCEMEMEDDIKCQFTSSDFVIVLSSIFTGTLLMELVILLIDLTDILQADFGDIKVLYDRLNKTEYSTTDNIELTDELLKVVDGSGESKEDNYVDRRKSDGAHQRGIPYDDNCDLFHLVRAMTQIHGRAKTFVFLSIVDEKVKLSWRYEKQADLPHGVSLERSDRDFWEMHVTNLLIEFNAPPQVYFKVTEIDMGLHSRVGQSFEWKTINLKKRLEGGIDWDTDPLEINLYEHLGFSVSRALSLSLTVIVVWNKRQIWEGNFSRESVKQNYDHGDNSDFDTIPVPMYAKSVNPSVATVLPEDTIANHVPIPNSTPAPSIPNGPIDPVVSREIKEEEPKDAMQMMTLNPNSNFDTTPIPMYSRMRGNF